MWNCPKCSETNDDSTDVCWNCGTSSEGVEDAEFRRADDVGAECEGDRPLVEVLPESNVPEALQPREQKPVPRPRWRAAICPNCGSRNLAVDGGAAPWLAASALALIAVGFLLHAIGHSETGLMGYAAGGVLLLYMGLILGFTQDAWCRDCGVRFKKVDRLERSAQEDPLAQDDPEDG